MVEGTVGKLPTVLSLFGTNMRRIIVTRDVDQLDCSAQDAEGNELGGLCVSLDSAAKDYDKFEQDLRDLASRHGCKEILDPVFGGQVLTLNEYFGVCITQSGE